MEKIKMPHPIAELDGDEMTHVLWGKIKEQLILPFVELNTEYYDLGLPNRERTADQVTQDAAEAIRRLHIGVKCATITPNLQRQEEYGLSRTVEVPQRHHPGGVGRHGVPGSHPHFTGQARGDQLEKARHHRPPRLR